MLQMLSAGSEKLYAIAEEAVGISSQGQSGESGTMTVSSYLDVDMRRTAAAK